jgi:methionyl-tRNA formyltransferase
MDAAVVIHVREGLIRGGGCLKMRVVFLGTPELAGCVLEALFASRHSIAAVVTRPDMPKGRSGKPVSTPVKETALRLGLPFMQTKNVNEQVCIGFIRDMKPDALVVVAFGQIFKRSFFESAPKYILNLHASLLPKYRGANPIATAIMDGEKITGVSVMQVVNAVDAGPVYLQKKIPILDSDTTDTLTKKIASLGGTAVVETLDSIEAGSAVSAPQDESKATYAAPFSKSDGLVDWTTDAYALERRIRALDPWPGAFTFIKRTGMRIRILQAERTDGNGDHGAVLTADEKGILVAAGGGALFIKRLQAAGRNACTAAEFLRGNKLVAGDLFDNGTS